MSNTQSNKHTGLAVVCPLTIKDRKFPFHVAIHDHPEVTGFVIAEPVKSIDYHARNARKIESSSEVVLEEVFSILDACIY